MCGRHCAGFRVFVFVRVRASVRVYLDCDLYLTDVSAANLAANDRFFSES